MKPWLQNFSEKQWIPPHLKHPYTYFEEASRTQLNHFFQGVKDYRQSHYFRSQDQPQCCWKKGSAQLYHFKPHNKGRNKTLFIVPSLVNRSTILDLMPEQSLVKYFTNQGYRVLLLDWGAPQEAEKKFSLEEYYTSYLLAAFDFICANYKADLHLFGYCMGGVFTLALAEQFPEMVKKLILLATPWDFHSKNMSFPRHALTNWQSWIEKIGPDQFVAPDFIQYVFFTRSPFQVIKKYAKFAANKQDAFNHKKFVAVEDWINDGVPITQKVALECLSNWYLENAMAKHQWRLGKRLLSPDNIQCPTLIIAPRKDSVVSSDATKNLQHLMQQSKIYEPNTGHVGLMVSSQAEKMWAHIEEWLKI